MASFDTQSLHALDDEQIERLAAIVAEGFGQALRRTQFDDVVLLMFEDIAGFEVMTQQQQASKLRSAWAAYRRLVASTRSR